MPDAVEGSTGRRPAIATLPFLLAAPAAIVLVVGVVIPLAGLLRTSLYATSGTFDGDGFAVIHYARFLTDPYYLGVFAETAGYAAGTTAIALLLGFPVGYHLARLPASARRWRLVIVLSPLTLSLVVVIFGWLVVLGRQGLVNQVMVAIGLFERPQRLLYNEFAVLVVLVAQFLPFMILPVMSVCAGIDRGLEEAGASLRAGRLAVLRRVVVPLAMPGIIAGCLLVFVLSLSAFLTPRLVGGQRIKMVGSLIYEQTISVRNWPFAAAMSVILTLTIVAATMLVNRSRFSGRAAHVA